MQSFELDGVKFNWTYENDYDMDHPWVENELHGIVTSAPLRFGFTKSPGQVVIHRVGSTVWVYDVKKSIELAKRDCWGLNDKAAKALQCRLGKQPTQKQITAEAVRLDMEFCRSYLEDEVQWFSVCCWPAEDSDQKQWLGGILCEEGDGYLEECAKELATGHIKVSSREQENLASEQYLLDFTLPGI